MPFLDRCHAMKPILARAAVAAALTLACAQAPSGAQQPCSQPNDSSKTLSDKLDQGGGVICPLNVDPGMKTPAPETGKMPVIPPPGSPGGDPKVQPK